MVCERRGELFPDAVDATFGIWTSSLYPEGLIRPVIAGHSHEEGVLSCAAIVAIGHQSGRTAFGKHMRRDVRYAALTLDAFGLRIKPRFGVEVVAPVASPPASA